MEFDKYFLAIFEKVLGVNLQVAQYPRSYRNRPRRALFYMISIKIGHTSSDKLNLLIFSSEKYSRVTQRKHAHFEVDKSTNTKQRLMKLTIYFPQQNITQYLYSSLKMESLPKYCLYSPQFTLSFQKDSEKLEVSLMVQGTNVIYSTVIKDGESRIEPLFQRKISNLFDFLPSLQQKIKIISLEISEEEMKSLTDSVPQKFGVSIKRHSGGIMIVHKTGQIEFKHLKNSRSVRLVLDKKHSNNSEEEKLNLLFGRLEQRMQKKLAEHDAKIKKLETQLVAERSKNQQLNRNIQGIKNNAKKEIEDLKLKVNQKLQKLENMRVQESSKLTSSSTQIGNKGFQQTINHKISNLLKIIQDYNHIKSEAIANLTIKVNKLANGKPKNTRQDQMLEVMEDNNVRRNSNRSYRALRFSEDDNENSHQLSEQINCKIGNVQKLITQLHDELFLLSPNCFTFSPQRKTLFETIKSQTTNKLNSYEKGLQAFEFNEVINGVENENVSTIDLRYNNMGALGVRFLTIKEWPMLQCLYLGYNQINDQGTFYLSSKPWSSLKVLYLDNNCISDRGVKNLACKEWKNLQILYLDGNKISDQGIEYLVLNEWGNLQWLYLERNKISDGGAQLLMQKQWSNLQQLYLADNHLSQDRKTNSPKVTNRLKQPINIYT